MKLYYENVLERGPNNTVIQSTVRLATRKEIDAAKKLHRRGKCPHTIIKDESGWMYDFRSCAICGKGLGAI